MPGWRGRRATSSLHLCLACSTIFVAESSYARHWWEVHGQCVPDSHQNTAGARDRVLGLLRIDAYLGPIIPDAAQLDTEAEIAAEVARPPCRFHEIQVNRSLKGGVLREDPAFEREERGYRLEGGVVRTRGGTVEPAVRQKKLRVAKCVDRPIPFGPRVTMRTFHIGGTASRVSEQSTF